MDLADYDYHLPASRIAQEPTPERDGARLLRLARASGRIEHASIRELPALLRPGDLLVRNATRVLPARLRGRKASGGSAEALLLGALPGRPGCFAALLRATGRARPGAKLRFGPPEAALEAELLERGEQGRVVLAFPPDADPYAAGEAPLPPYIRRPAPRPADAARYQTVYARVPGSVAAPTAGLHLSQALLARLAERGIACADLVLHVGPGTFQPLTAGRLERGRLPGEAYRLPPETAAAIAATRARGGRVIAVGTTSARVLETCATPDGSVAAGEGVTELFLRPGSRFRVLDGLLTNLHLPRSSLLLLVAAFAGREPLLAAYHEAIREGYRFYSYGDAMLVL
jgi:S-adenosylmethionine:tRNA ribosyltransferase-isomerase